MSERLSPPPSRFRGTLQSDGDLGPIEERYGRRLMRLIDPESDEGTQLLDSGKVELLGPDGETFGPLKLREAYRRLCHQLERRLERLDDERSGDTSDAEARAITDCLTRVRVRQRARNLDN